MEKIKDEGNSNPASSRDVRDDEDSSFDCGESEKENRVLLGKAG